MRRKMRPAKGESESVIASAGKQSTARIEWIASSLRASQLPQNSGERKTMAVSQAQTGASQVDVADFIDQQPVGGFQIKLLLTCAAVLFLDGFDTPAIGYVAPGTDKRVGVRRVP